MPPGHSNAIFLDDANQLLQDDPVPVFREANRQGGFTFWNHPHWTSQRPDGVATLTGLHRQLIDEGLLHGIEVANDSTYSDEVLQIVLDQNLTITLVFATEHSAAGIKEALHARRTGARFNNLLVGRKAPPAAHRKLPDRSASSLSRRHQRAHQTTRLAVKTLDRKIAVSLLFEVLNAVTAPNVHPELVLEVTVEQRPRVSQDLRNRSPYVSIGWRILS